MTERLWKYLDSKYLGGPKNTFLFLEVSNGIYDVCIHTDTYDIFIPCESLEDAKETFAHELLCFLDIPIPNDYKDFFRGMESLRELYG